jgi:hypothetical protein
VHVTGDLVLTGGDVAEEFDVAEQVADPSDVCPGTVVVLDTTPALRAPSRVRVTAPQRWFSIVTDTMEAILPSDRLSPSQARFGAGRMPPSRPSRLETCLPRLRLWDMRWSRPTVRQRLVRCWGRP